MASAVQVARAKMASAVTRWLVVKQREGAGSARTAEAYRVVLARGREVEVALMRAADERAARARGRAEERAVVAEGRRMAESPWGRG